MFRHIAVLRSPLCYHLIVCLWIGACAPSVKGVTVAGKARFEVKHAVLCTAHSAAEVELLRSSLSMSAYVKHANTQQRTSTSESECAGKRLAIMGMATTGPAIRPVVLCPRF